MCGGNCCALVCRWWIRNARTNQVLGSVFAQTEDEALGKAMVKYGMAGWQADKYLAQKGQSDATGDNPPGAAPGPRARVRKPAARAKAAPRRLRGGR